MYQIYSKDRKSLQFPAMCDGYVKIPWADGTGTPPKQNVGLWGQTGGITIEFLVTPYDINNHTTPYSGSQKSLSQATKGVAYSPAADRDLHYPHLLYNTKLSVYLIPPVTGSISPITPTKYKIAFQLNIGSVQTLVTSDFIITPEVIDDTSSGPTFYLYSQNTPFAKKSFQTVSSVSSTTINLSGSSAEYVVGENVYTNTGLLIGEVASLGSNAITVVSITNTPSNSTYIYAELPKEPTYVNIPHHIAVSYDPSGAMVIFYDGKEVARGKHDTGGDFSFNGSDIILGQYPRSLSYQGTRRSQFMGEYHEISITGGYNKTFKSTNSLIPVYNNTLLYMDFEEVNLDG